MENKDLYEWVVTNEEHKIFAYKKHDENPVFIDAERAVLQLVKELKVIELTNRNISHLISDLSRCKNF